jgi:hypothetical protein
MKTAQILTIISLSCLFISLVSSFLTKIPVVVKNVFFLVAVVLLATSQVVKCKPEELSEKQITTVDLKSLKRFSMNDNNSINKSKILGESKDLWDNYKDRKFMNDFYPHLSKFDTILDIGARNYNKRCKNLINSQSSHGRSTKYYQLEPFPGKYIDNDGLLKCFVQYSLIKYPEFQEFFDVVIDFGVLGWDQIKLSNKDIEIYLQNILGLLKPNGLYVLKVDSSSRKNFLNFCRFIEPYFNYTDFTGYKNGTLVDDDMRVYFLTKKHNISLSIPNDLIKDLVITAHPDDESIWVGEILGPLCAVILVTCENETRFNEFKQVMDKTGVKNWQILNFPDSKDHREETSLWKIKDLIPKVRKVMKSFPDLENIYTHNANGEYGHPDHKSVHQAVTAAYAQEYNLDDNKPELYVFAPNGVTDKQGYPNSGCTCTESSLRKSLIDIYDEKLKGTQSVQQFRNLCPRVRNISSQIVQDVVDVVIPWAGEPKDDTKHTGNNRDDGIIKYTIRSICKNMPWVRNIIVFMDPPTDNISFIKNESDEIKSKVRFVNRCKYFINSKDNCPSMNFYAILPNIHRIPFLSEKWLQIDDDIIITKPLSISEFFVGNNIRLDTDFKEDSLYGSEDKVRVPKSDRVAKAHYVKLPSKLPLRLQFNGNSHRIMPQLKSVWKNMYHDFTEWFEFVSSHKYRFCFGSPHTTEVYDKLDGGCCGEDTQKAYYWYANKKNKVFYQKTSGMKSLEYNDISSPNLLNIIKNLQVPQININDTCIWEGGKTELLNHPKYFKQYENRLQNLHNALEMLFT